MRRYLALILLFGAVWLTGCNKDAPPEPEPLPEIVDQTVLMYLPWSNDLTYYFYKNITTFETAIGSMNLRNQRVLAFICDPADEAILYELKGSGGKNARTVLKNYKDPAFTTAAGITSILEDVKYFAPADNYAMTIGCHGLGWIPVPTSSSNLRGVQEEKLHWEYGGEGATRYFGGTQSKYQTDVTTLAKGIANAGIRMQYILFDDCYMSTIEVAYDLKDVTDHLIGCPTEIMAEGMPYAKIGKYLIGNVNYEKVCEEFYNYYSNNGTYSCGTIGVIVTSELEAIAAVMKRINNKFIFDESEISTVQRMDGYNPVIFFDMGDYVTKLCADPILLQEFEAQLKMTVPHKKNTPSYYSNPGGGFFEIKAFSGVTISDPSTNTRAGAKTETAWFRDTH